MTTHKIVSLDSLAFITGGGTGTAAAHLPLPVDEADQIKALEGYCDRDSVDQTVGCLLLGELYLKKSQSYAGKSQYYMRKAMGAQVPKDE